MVNLIGSTRTRKGLQVQAELDTNQLREGIKVTDEEMESVRLKKDKFHGEWNYTIEPHPRSYNCWNSYFGPALSSPAGRPC